MLPEISRLFVVSGPSGAGKGTVLSQVRAKRPDLALPVSANTRAPRPGEINGKDYWFMSEAHFKELVCENAFVEWAHVHDCLKGTLKSEVTEKLASGASLVLEIDVQGAQAIKESFPDAVLIFIKPPSLEVLRKRLEGRGSETPESLELRMKVAQDEIALANAYDEQVVNDDLDNAVNEMLRIMNYYETN